MWVFLWVKIMNEVLKQANDVTVFSDGSAFISQRRVAKLCGVNRSALQKYLTKMVATLNVNIYNQIDAKSLALVATYYAKQNRREAIETLAMFAEAGAKAFLYHEAGYEFKAMRREDIAAQLAEAQKKLAYCAIHADSPKATFELRDNAKVNAIKESWCELGYLTKRTFMKPVTEYGITPE
jgi:predicted transcriptional regulator